MVKISILVPFHFMPNWDLYLERCLKSIEGQTFKDYEIITMKYDRAANTQNRLIKDAQGELLKILHMDDCFTSPDSLQRIVDNFSQFDYWQAAGCYHSVDFGEPTAPHFATYAQDIHTGNNTIGAPSVVTFRNGLGVYFDEDLDWLYDVSLYKKLYDQYGPPKILDEYPITVGLHSGQLTHQIPDDIKRKEVELMSSRYHV